MITTEILLFWAACAVVGFLIGFFGFGWWTDRRDRR